MTGYTHSDLVARGARWLSTRFRCGVVLTEARSQHSIEEPDVIGWRGDRWSVLVECKVSRADFRADQRKPHRALRGMGQERWYLAPAGLLHEAEMPEGWGLAELTDGGVVRVRLKPPGSALRDVRGVLDFGVCAAEMPLLIGLAWKVLAGRFGDGPVEAEDVDVQGGSVTAAWAAGEG